MELSKGEKYSLIISLSLMNMIFQCIGHLEKGERITNKGREYIINHISLITRDMPSKFKMQLYWETLTLIDKLHAVFRKEEVNGNKSKMQRI